MNISEENLLVSVDDALDQLRGRLAELQSLVAEDASLPQLSEWFNRAESTFDAVFEEGGSQYIDKNSGFVFSYWVDRPRQLESANTSRTQGIIKKVVRQVEELSSLEISVSTASESPTVSQTEIFVVHGHSEEHISQIARTIEALGLIPIILREQPNMGATIIEKFERHSAVGFAVVLMTDDDLGGAKASEMTDVQFMPRARQNVILELGYFIGKLGRSRVCVLKSASVEEPSDIFGVVYTELDGRGNWRFQLAKELKAAGYAVSADSIL